MMVKSVGSNKVVLKNDKGWEIKPAIIDVSDHEISRVNLNPSDKDIALCEHWFEDDLITPGFMDSHTHLCLQFLRGGISGAAAGNLVEDLFFKLEEKLTPADVKAFSMMGAYEVLLSGTTFVWDHYYYGDGVAQAMKEVGLTGTIASTLQDLSGPGKHLWEMGLSFTEELDSDLDLKKHGIFSALGPHATDTVSRALWKKINDLATKRNLAVHCHVAQSPEEYLRVESHSGLSPVAYLDQIGILDLEQPKHLVHMIYASGKDLELGKKPKTRLVACPHSQMIFHFPASYLDWWRKGNLWTVGTDCSASNDSWNMPEELRTLAGWPMVSASFSPQMSNFMTDPSKTNLENLSLHRKRLIGENLLSQDELLNVLFLGSSDGAPSHEKVTGISQGSLANLLIFNGNDPAFWPASNLLRALVFNSLQTALKGIMTVGLWRGEIGQPRRTLIDSEIYLDARTEAFQRLYCLLKRAGIRP